MKKQEKAEITEQYRFNVCAQVLVNFRTAMLKLHPKLSLIVLVSFQFYRLLAVYARVARNHVFFRKILHYRKKCANR